MREKPGGLCVYTKVLEGTVLARILSPDEILAHSVDPESIIRSSCCEAMLVVTIYLAIAVVSIRRVHATRCI